MNRQGEHGLLQATTLMALAMAAVTLLTACQHRGPLKTRDAVGDFFNNFAEHSRMDEPMSLSVRGPVEVDVENFAGNVEIEIDDSRESAIVQVKRVAAYGFGRKEEAKASLSAIEWDAEIVSGELGPVLQVRTRSKGMEPHMHAANVYIAVPEISGLRIRSKEGKIDARGISGPIDIEHDRGRVLIVAGEPLVDPITIINRKGDIDLRAVPETTGRLDFETVNGRTLHRVQVGNLKVFPESDSTRLKARLNDGENKIVLRNIDANIRFAVVRNPGDFGAYIFD